MKFLTKLLRVRREKEIMSSRLDLLQAESARAATQLENHQKMAADAQQVWFHTFTVNDLRF